MGKIDVVEALIDMKYEIDRPKANGVTAVGISALANNERIFGKLIKAKADLFYLNSKGIGILYLGIKGNAINLIKEMLFRGVPILNVKDKNHIVNSPIFFAASSDLYEESLKVIV